MSIKPARTDGVLRLRFLIVASLVVISGMDAAGGQNLAPSASHPPLSDTVAPVALEPIRFRTARSYGSGASGAGSVVVVDVNGDHKPDLVVSNGCLTNTDCSTGSVGILLGNGDGTFQPAVVYSTGGSFAGNVAIADLKGDGKLDLVVPNCGPISSPGCPSDTGSVAVLLGNGDGTFQPAVTYDSGGVDARSVAIFDLNGDGKLDVVVANRGKSFANNGSVAVLLGNGDGSLRPAVTYDYPGDVVSVAVRDMNRDGKPDVVVVAQASASGGGNVLVFLGKGDGTLRPPTVFGTGGQIPWAVAIADVNGNAKLDLLVVNACGAVGFCGPGVGSGWSAAG